MENVICLGCASDRSVGAPHFGQRVGVGGRALEIQAAY